MRSVVERNVLMRHIPVVTDPTEVLETSICKAKVFQEEQRTSRKLKPGKTTNYETSIIINQSARHHITENLNLYQQRCKNLQTRRIYLNKFNPGHCKCIADLIPLTRIYIQHNFKIIFREHSVLRGLEL